MWAVAFLAAFFGASVVAHGEELYIPHIDPSSAWRNILQVNNPGGEPASFALTLYNQGTSAYSGTMEVAAGSYQAIDLETLAPIATTGTVDTDSSALQFRIAYEHKIAGWVAEFSLSDDSYRQVGCYFANFAPSITWKGIALMNTGPSAESVTLYAMGEGRVLDSATESIPARGRIVGIHSSWFGDIAGRLLSSAAVNAEDFVPDGEQPPPTVGAEYVVVAWNDLGMHCLNPTYDQAVILPPYNTIWAQVIRRGASPQLVTEGLTVEYRILNNTYSDGKREFGQFWEYDQVLFGIDLVPDTGLNLKHPSVHNSLSGTMTAEGDHFEVHGIPVTPVEDNLVYDPYQVAEITVKDAAGTIVAQTQATVPVSDEIECARCHGPNPFRDALQKHPLVDGVSLTTQTPVLCASCHASPVLGSPPGDRGSAGTYLSEAIHGSHADRGATCYTCHPGMTAKCSRSIPHTAADGNCITCHGTMAQMAQQISSDQKVPWVDEPTCAGCHMVTGVDTGTVLYRDAAGHGGVYCAGCHQSPHAMVPSQVASDNYQALQYQGVAVALGSCGCFRELRCLS